MSLTHEAHYIPLGYTVGDLKIAHYSITYIANALTEPANDPGWFLLNGAVLSQTTYSFLFNKYGTAYNTGGEGSGNFRLPDTTEGRAMITKGLTNFMTRGVTGGEILHILTAGELPSHTHGNTLAWSSVAHSHGISGSINADSGHTHSGLSSVGTGSRVAHGTSSSNASITNGTGTTNGASAGHFHNLSISISGNTSSVSLSGSVSSTGNNGGHNNMQPYLVVGGWLVKYK